MLALTVSLPIGSAITGVFMQRLRTPPFYIFLVAGALQIIGLALMSTLSATEETVAPATYGYEVILGFGFGVSLSTAVMAIPLVVDKRDMGTFHAIQDYQNEAEAECLSRCDGCRAPVSRARRFDRDCYMYQRPQQHGHLGVAVHPHPGTALESHQNRADAGGLTSSLAGDGQAGVWRGLQ